MNGGVRINGAEHPKKSPRRVLIGTPAYEWATHVRYTNAFGLTIKACIGAGIDLRWLFPPGDAILQNAFNELVAKARANNFDDLVIIGADQDWEPEGFLQLLSYPVDCVAGPVRKKADEPERYNVKTRLGASSMRAHPTLPLLTSPDLAVGTGFMRLTRKAMDILWEPAEKYDHPDGGKMEERAWIFDIRPINRELVGEDIHICHTLRAHGLDIWLDPGIASGHSGMKRWVGNFPAWLSRLQAEDAARPTQ